MRRHPHPSLPGASDRFQCGRCARAAAKESIPAKLKGIRRKDIPNLAGYAAQEANPLYPVPRLMDTGELERFYYDVRED